VNHPKLLSTKDNHLGSRCCHTRPGKLDVIDHKPHAGSTKLEPVNAETLSTKTLSTKTLSTKTLLTKAIDSFQKPHQRKERQPADTPGTESST
jgi:hypothetical protein